MTEDQTTSGSRAAFPDPFEAWRAFYQASEKNWEAFFHEVLSTDTFAAALGRTLEGYLNTQGAFAKALERYMEQYLKAINVPSRADITRIAGMIVALENKVDAVAATVESLEDVPAALKQLGEEVASVVTRTAGLAGIKRELDQVAHAVAELNAQIAEQQRTLQEIAEQQRSLAGVGEQQQVLYEMADRQQQALQELHQGLDELQSVLQKQTAAWEQVMNSQRSVTDEGVEALTPEGGDIGGNGARRSSRRRASAEASGRSEAVEHA
jgi:polyhydroxyalkanoic acid synthase PhaR subunit